MNDYTIRSNQNWRVYRTVTRESFYRSTSLPLVMHQAHIAIEEVENLGLNDQVSEDLARDFQRASSVLVQRKCLKLILKG